MVEERTPAIPSVRGIDLSGLWSILVMSQGVLVLPVATAFACLVAWQAIAVYGEISPTILPPPTMVLQQLALNFWLILKHTIPTTYETLLAFGLSIPLGIMLAGLMIYSKLAYQALYPNIVFFQLIPKIALATSFPFIFSGMKVAVTLAIIGIVVGEFIASQQGLGYLILFASSRQQTDLALACIAVLCVVGIALYGCVAAFEKLLMRWYDTR